MLAITLTELLARWDSKGGHPGTGELVNMDDYLRDPADPNCMCAQGQGLHFLGGITVEDLSGMPQHEADQRFADLLGISRAHSVLLRFINDGDERTPSIVLTHPEKVLGGQYQTVLAFWRHMDRMTSDQWAAADAAADAKADAADYAAADAFDAAGAAVGFASRNAVRISAEISAKISWAFAGNAARGATYEIQGAAIMRAKGQAFYFLPLFGFADPEAVLLADKA